MSPTKLLFPEERPGNTRHSRGPRRDAPLSGKGTLLALAQEEVLWDQTIGALPGKGSPFCCPPGPWFRLVGSGSLSVVLHGHVVVLGADELLEGASSFCESWDPKRFGGFLCFVLLVTGGLGLVFDFCFLFCMQHPG